MVCEDWIETTGCNSNGAVQEGKKKDCEKQINKDWSGYCACKGGWKAMEKACDKLPQYENCNAACSGK